MIFQTLLFDNYKSIDFHYTRTFGLDAKMWKLGSHGRHFRVSEHMPMSKLVELNEKQGFFTHYFFADANSSEIFVQNLANIKYVNRLTWIRTIVMFDETNNLNLSPILGSNHDLVSANDTCIYRLDSSKSSSCTENIKSVDRKFIIQIKLSLKEDGAPISLKFITRLYAKNSLSLPGTVWYPP